MSSGGDQPAAAEAGLDGVADLNIQDEVRLSLALYPKLKLQHGNECQRGCICDSHGVK